MMGVEEMCETRLARGWAREKGGCAGAKQSQSLRLSPIAVCMSVLSA